MKRGRGGVQYEDILPGGGAVALRGSTVEIRYNLRLNHGEILRERVFELLRVGARQVIPGLEYGVEGMREGGQRRIRVGPHLGYGPKGVPGLIPPNAVLEFDVTLLSVR